MSRSGLAVLIAAAGCATQQAAREPTPPRLPASFYDVEAAGDLGFGAEASTSWTGPSRVGMADQHAPGLLRSPAFGMADAPRFIVDQDSLLYRNGRERVELATLAIVQVAEVAYPASSPWKWAQVTYLDAVGDPHTVYFRQRRSRAQGAFVAAIRHAAEVARAAHANEPDATPPR